LKEGERNTYGCNKRRGTTDMEGDPKTYIVELEKKEGGIVKRGNYIQKRLKKSKQQKQKNNKKLKQKKKKKKKAHQKTQTKNKQ